MTKKSYEQHKHNVTKKILCYYYRIKIDYFYCIHFVYWTSSFIKSLNKFNLIEINLQTNFQNWEA